ncbi:MAG: M56 family metallopeptidase [Saprospiraceae bacterium]|nr:M56 family metallopeptidase [Saprospiraceae bacterium]
MEVVMYLLKVNIVLATLFGAYWLLLRNERFFQLNRLILLGIVLLSLLMPILPQWQGAPSNNQLVQRLSQNIADISPFEALAPQESSATSDNKQKVDKKAEQLPLDTSATTALSIDWLGLARWAYLGILGILFFSFLFQLIKLFAIQYERDHIPDDGFVRVQHDRDIPPFSFFKLLVINPRQYDDQKLEQIIKHERIHIKQWHTLDILLLELMSIICWFNPVIWVFKRYVKLNLEYIADEAVLGTGINKKAYQYHLLFTSANVPNYRLSNMFNSSPIKLRIKMMNSNKSSNAGLLKYAFILPVVLGLYMFVHPQLSQAQSAEAIVSSLDPGEKKIALASEDNIYILINPQIKKKTLEDISQKLAQHAIYFRVKNKNYNDGLLSSIRVQMEIPNRYKATTIEEEGEDGYFEPIIFALENEGNEQNIFFGKGIPANISDKGREILTQNLENGMVIQRKKGGWHMTGRANF